MVEETVIPGVVAGGYQEDLSDWESVDDVPLVIRDLPAKYGIRETDIALPYPAHVLRDRIKDTNIKIREEALAYAKSLYYLVLNLMRIESGLDFTSKDVDKWTVDELRGVVRHGKTNLGNDRARSDRVAAEEFKYGTAKDAEPGVFFRMVSYKDNFFVLLASLRYFSGEATGPKARDRHEAGRKLLEFVRASV